MAELLFPDRQRCAKCRGGLDEVVLLGKFCSARCAGMAPVPTDPAKAPRECVTTRDGKTVFKRRYRSVAEIPDRIRADFSVSEYTCQVCGHWHIGHSRAAGPEPLRMLTDPGDLPDVLIKLRGKATRTQVAKVAGVRPIRLKELEEGVGHPESLATLFKVLPVLQAGLGVQLRQGAGR